MRSRRLPSSTCALLCLLLAACGDPAREARQAEVDALVRRLEAPDANEVAQALVALGRLGPDALSAAPGLARLIGAGRADVAHQATYTYSTLPEAALPHLAPWADAPDPNVRARVVGVVARSTWSGTAALDLLVRAAGDGEWTVRRSAVQGLGARATRSPRAADVLARVAGDEHPHVAARAVEGLGNLGPAAAPHVDALAKVLASPQGPLRTAAARTLGRIGPDARSALPALEQALASESGAAEAALAVARWRVTGETEPSLGRLVATLSKDSTIAIEAVQGLGEMGPAAAPAAPALTRALADRGLRLAAAEALAAIGPGAEPARAALEGLTEDPNAAMRVAARKALDALGPKGAR